LRRPLPDATFARALEEYFGDGGLCFGARRSGGKFEHFGSIEGIPEAHGRRGLYGRRCG
jgi:hypothetical protein